MVIERDCQENRERLKASLIVPNYLPSIAEIKQVFPVLKPSDKWDDEAYREWHKFCNDWNNPIFEFLNKEYIEALADYIRQRAEVYTGDGGNPLTVLETGAGNGKLVHFLGQKLNQIAPNKVRIVATDNGRSEIPQHFPVERIGYKKAIEKYQPAIIITSWMPVRRDWTRVYRAQPNVEEYILIGETGGGCCGAPSVWGFTSDKRKKDFVPEYEREGFTKIYLDDLSQLQIGRTDTHGSFKSCTVSFRRNQASATNIA